VGGSERGRPPDDSRRPRGVSGHRRPVLGTSEGTDSRKVTFVYAKSRRTLLREIASGSAPDTSLFGQNHLHDLGIRSEIHEPRLRPMRWRNPVLNRALWSVREVPLPWEIGQADVVCTPLAGVFPLMSRLRPSQRTLVLNVDLCNRLSRASAARRRLLIASLRASAAVVCFAEAQRQRLLEQTDLDAERVHAVAFGVDERFFAPCATTLGGYVLAVGRDLGRDYRTLIEAIRATPYQAIIVAERYNVPDLPLPANVQFRFNVSYSELRELYACACCVVVPSRREDCHLGSDCSGQTCLLDAMAVAKPVIASWRSAISEYVAEGRTAITVPPEDPVALREAIARILGDEGLASRLGAAARRAIGERYTTRHLAARLASVLQTVEG
jgi:glycosyltransferase involved in cell wall biosynthesis